MSRSDRFAAARVANEGASCTTASVLTALRLLGAEVVPPLAEATLALGAAVPLGAPALMDYVSWPGRRAPLDLRIEALASRLGTPVTSRTGLVLPAWPIRPRDDEVVVANLAWGQESPGHRGPFGWHPLRPSTYSTGGHSVVLAALDPDGTWLVIDPNHPGVQHWPRPGIALTLTRLHPR